MSADPDDSFTMKFFKGVRAKEGHFWNPLGGSDSLYPKEDEYSILKKEVGPQTALTLVACDDEPLTH